MVLHLKAGVNLSPQFVEWFREGRMTKIKAETQHTSSEDKKTVSSLYRSVGLFVMLHDG